jgi:hypothetical protein
MPVVGNHHEIFFNKESKSGTWEVTYDSTNDNVLLECYENHGDDCQKIEMTKAQFSELKRFLKTLKLTKNRRIKIK